MVVKILHLSEYMFLLKLAVHFLFVIPIYFGKYFLLDGHNIVGCFDLY